LKKSLRLVCTICFSSERPLDLFFIIRLIVLIKNTVWKIKPCLQTLIPFWNHASFHKANFQLHTSWFLIG
jgi:hypothetical protein